MGTPAEHRRLEPGLHVLTDTEPLKRASHLASELGGDLCATLPQADLLLAELGALPPLTAEALEVLGQLTHRVAAAQRIVDGTLDRAALEVGERLAASGSGMAIHPSAVRDRAAAVLAARAALATAEEELRAGEAGSAVVVADPPLPPPPSAPSRVASFEDEPLAPRRRRFFGFGRRGRERREKEDTSESTSLLQQMAASTDEAFGARRANAVRDDQLVLFRVQRDRAREDLRVRERAWHDLAGEASADDVEAVVRRFDPQHQDAVAVAQETVGVRAASTLLQRALDRWEEGWRSRGFDPPSSADPVAMDQMAERLARPVVLVAYAVDHAELVALAAPAAPVVVVEEEESAS